MCISTKKGITTYIASFFLVCVFTIYGHAQPANGEILPEHLAMSRSQMYLEDTQVVLFNGIGSINPRQHSITGLTNPKFYPVDLRSYDFHFNFLDNNSGEIIQDNTPALWKEWIERRKGTDSLGANFRPGFAKLVVTQDETWQPNQYHRMGVFHKKFENNWVSMRLESWTRVSGVADEVLIKLKLTNMDSGTLSLTLVPQHIAEQLRARGSKGSRKAKRDGPFIISSDQCRATVVSDIPSTSEKGFVMELEPGESKDYYFALQFSTDLTSTINVYQENIKTRFENAYERTVERLRKTFGKLPTVKTDHARIDELYKRCALTLNECRWERDNFIVTPFWASGTWPISMIWDQCFAEEALALVDPDGLREAIKLELRECKMKQSYIYWHGAVGYVIYLQNPFALQTTIEAYIVQTGDEGIFDEVTGDATVYEWMKRWAFELRENYSRPDGLIDVGFSTEKIIEIRTDGYNHVVPVMNGLTISFFEWMSKIAARRGDKDANKFKEWHNQLYTSFHEKLWNDEEGWFDNLYPDGTKARTWAHHLFDLLETDVLSHYQKSRLAAHLTDGRFLAPYGMYSISKHDTLHWDRIDSDWGGGGQYVGMTLRIAKSLLENGFHVQGFEILKRFSLYTDHFPYLTHNPLSDKLSQDLSSMPLQISAGAGIDAVIRGIFGIVPQKDGSIIIDPAYDQELGNAQLTGYSFRGNTYDVVLGTNTYKVKRNGEIINETVYGEVTKLDF